MDMMSRPSDAETAILNVLWARQPCSVKAVHETLSTSKDVGYTTTLKQMQRLLDKGLVAREPGPGKSFLYTATITEDEARQRLFDRFVQTAFGNSVSDLVMHALGNARPSETEIEQIKTFLEGLDRTEST